MYIQLSLCLLLILSQNSPNLIERVSLQFLPSLEDSMLHLLPPHIISPPPPFPPAYWPYYSSLIFAPSTTLRLQNVNVDKMALLSIA